MSRFKVSRADGRTNAEVLIGLVSSAEPGALLDYATLAAALGEGTDRQWARLDVQSAVNASLRKLRRQTKRTLIPVAGQGYRIPLASEHVAIAKRRDDKGLKQFGHAKETLEHTNAAELSPWERMRWEEQLAINCALYAQIALVTRRQQKQDAAIESLLSRVERLESIPV